MNAIFCITITPPPLPPWPCSILNKLLSIRHGNKVNLIWSATQIKAKKTKKKVLLTYTGSVQLWRSSLRERETERERVHGPKKLFQVQRRDDHWLLKKKTVALNVMLLCNKLPLSLSVNSPTHLITLFLTLAIRHSCSVVCDPAKNISHIQV